MRYSVPKLLSALCLTTASLVTGDVLGDSACGTLNVDVAVVGGGASGAYAAVRLKEDYNKKVVLIEKERRLGGHVAEYVDPESGRTFEYGVQQFNDYGPARAFFQRLGVTPAAPVRNPLTQRFVDFKTGLDVNYTGPAAADVTAAFQKWLEVVKPFEEYLLPGYWNFPKPDKIPGDLLLPFGQFVKKHGIEAAVPLAFQITAFGAGDFNTALTMYVLAAFNHPLIRFALGNATLFVPSSHRNLEVYETIQFHLKDEVLYNNTVLQSERKPNGHTLWVRDNYKSTCTIIQAYKLLVAIEPTDANMKPFALDDREREIFSKFSYQTVHVGIVSHSSLPAGVSLVNTPVAAANGRYWEVLKPNFNIRFDHMDANSTNWRVMVIANTSLSVSDAQRLVSTNLGALIAAGTVAQGNVSSLQFKAWSNHGNMHAHFSAEDVRTGSVQTLYGLQGHKGTWWTGGAWSQQFQSILWAYDDILLSKMFF